MDLKPGDVFAGLRIDGVAGRGGMGVVYRAVQPTLDRLVALKTIAPELAADESFSARFVRESKAAAAVEHPNVLPIFSAGEERGVLYIVMRYVDGPDLRRLIREHGRLPAGRAARIVAQVAAALDAAHARGLVHRDVKPANVLLDGDDHAYLTDFGLTKRLHSSASAMTRPGGWVGTLGYVAPEQIRDEQVDGRTDVYALGCVLFHALVGAPPYERSTDEATLWAHLNEEPPALPDGLPPALDAIVRRALAKEPAHRFPSAGELGRAVLAAVGRPAHSVAGLDAPIPPTAAEETRTTPPGAHPATAATARAGAFPHDPDAARSPHDPRTAPIPHAPQAARAPHDPHTAPVPHAPQAAHSPNVPHATPFPHDPRVGGPGASPRRGAGASPAQRGPKRAGARRGRLLGAAAAVAALVSAAAIATLSGGRDDDGAASGSRARAARTAPGSPLPAGVEVGARPNGVAVARGAAYVTVPRSDRLARVDLDRFSTAEPGPRVGRGALDVEAGFGALWVSSASDTERLARVDLDTGRTTFTPLPDGTPVAVEAGEGAVWVGIRGARRRAYPPPSVARVDRRTGEVVKVVPIPRGVQDLAIGRGAVWIANRSSDTVTRLDVKTGALDVIPVGRDPYGIAVGGGAVWVASGAEETVRRVSPQAGRSIATIGVVGQPRFVAYGAGSVWATTFTTNTLVRIDAKTNRPTGEPVELGVNPTKLVVSDGAVYAVSQADGILERVPIPDG